MKVKFLDKKIIFVLALLILVFVPAFLSSFILFSSPEKAFYFLTNKCTLVKRIDGDTTTLLIGEESDGTQNLTLLLRQSEKWRLLLAQPIPSYFQISICDQVVSGAVINETKSNGFYIYMSVPIGIDEILDSENSTFEKFDYNNNYLKTLNYNCVAYVKETPSDYRLYLNGNHYEIEFE